MIPVKEGARWRWRKSSRSNNTGGDCVEAGCAGGKRAVRDSKNASGPVLRMSGHAFTAFIAEVRSGRLDG